MTRPEGTGRRPSGTTIESFRIPPGHACRRSSGKAPIASCCTRSAGKSSRPTPTWAGCCPGWAPIASSAYRWKAATTRSCRATSPTWFRRTCAMGCTSTWSSTDEPSAAVHAAVRPMGPGSVQTGPNRVIPGTRSKSASLLASLVKPLLCIMAMISASPLSKPCWRLRSPANCTCWAFTGKT